MSASQLIAFWGVSFLLVLVPGPDWAYVMGAGLRERSVLPSTAGLLIGYVALTIVVATGVAAIVASHPSVLTALTALGAAYLIWLGIGPLTRPSVPETTGGGAGAWWAATLKGAGTSGLNPKGLLLFVALLPQFTEPDGGHWPLAVQIGALGLVHVISCGVVYPIVGVLARVVLGARPAIARLTLRASGAAMVLIGIGLLAEHLK